MGLVNDASGWGEKNGGFFKVGIKDVWVKFNIVRLVREFEIMLLIL